MALVAEIHDFVIGLEVNFVEDALAQKFLIVGTGSLAVRPVVLHLEGARTNLVRNEPVPFRLAQKILVILLHGIIDKNLFIS